MFILRVSYGVQASLYSLTKNVAVVFVDGLPFGIGCRYHDEYVDDNFCDISFDTWKMFSWFCGRRTR